MVSKHPTGPIRLFPSQNHTRERISVPLSILDATCARFTDTGAVWLFDAPSAASPEDLLGDRVVHRLRASFVDTLNDFPQWAGQLHWAPFRPGTGDHTQRFQRCMLTYGGGGGEENADPGVEWGVVRRDYTLDSIVPPGGGVWWDNDAFPQGDLVSPAKLALAGLKDEEGLPCMLVQITLFACGGYGVGVRLAHPVADAQSMMVFMHKWAANSRNSCDNASASPSLFGEPVFDPPRLDARAAGDIDFAAGPDPGLCAKARALPMHRFSWWDVEAPGYSPYLVGTTRNNMPPAEVLAETTLSPSTVAPWHTWDLGRPAASAVLHFTGENLERLRERARVEVVAGGDDDEEGRNNISRSDALLAHLFRLVTQARCAVKSSSYAPAADDEVFLNYPLEARRRVEPPLPETFLGSPLFMTHIKETKDLTNNGAAITTGALARQLRQALRQFTPDAVAALLHESAFEVAPQRLWRGFLGPRHLIVTSWLRTRLYDIDFGIYSGGDTSADEEAAGKGGRPRYVHAVMGKTDGILVLLDPVVDDGGVDVALYLDAEAMGELRRVVKGMRV
ncbi:transferase family protein [Apiospora marii]|uniref:Transferase family protein n=1 Tax=Apiospora marii TaxID=335849 RepID=A0ABR1RF16_9PEZI